MLTIDYHPNQFHQPQQAMRTVLVYNCKLLTMFDFESFLCCYELNTRENGQINGFSGYSGKCCGVCIFSTTLG